MSCELWNVSELSRSLNSPPSPTMPVKTKAQLQAEYTELAELYTVAAMIAEDDPYDDIDILEFQEPDDGEFLYDDTDFSGADALEAMALQWMATAASMAGTGSRGPYNQTPSTNWFTTSLQFRDRAFRYTYR